MIILLLKNLKFHDLLVKFHDFSMTSIFHDFPGLENSFLKSHDFPGRMWTLVIQVTSWHKFKPGRVSKLDGKYVEDSGERYKTEQWAM